MRSLKLKQFIREIQYDNRNPKDNSVLNMLEDKKTNPEYTLFTGDVLYRSRIISNDDKIGSEPSFFGFNESESFVPPPQKTKDMRANYRYIPYLYCANDRYISLVETRPRLGAQVSVAAIIVRDKIRLLDLTMREKTPSIKMTDVKVNLFNDLSELFSKPVTSDDDILDYIPTQYIAEYVKNSGYDGIAYKSSFDTQDTKANIVIFTYNKCKPIGSNIFQISKNLISYIQIDDDINRVKIMNPVQEILIGTEELLRA